MFNKYYQDELSYLRELGREFADRNPESAGWLAQPGVDPDVERLLEGFAFLTARIREKLDDELPELTHSLLQLFWPHYLRPIPSMAIAQFQLKPKAASKLQTVPRGAELASAPIDGTPCVFRTTGETPLVPLEVDEVEVGPSGSPYLLVRLTLGKKAALGKLGLERLRLHLAGTSAASRALYLTLCRYVKGVRARDAKGNEVALEGAEVVPLGFEADEALVPQPRNAFPGFRLLQEYFAFPAKFMFVELRGLAPLAQLGGAAGGGALELVFDLDHLPHDIPPIDASNVLLNCAPVVNLVAHSADPIRLDRKRVEYKARPAGSPQHYEIFSVDRVQGVRRGEQRRREYAPFFRTFRVDGPETLLYKLRIAEALTTSGTDTWVTFLEGGAPAVSDDETVSLELTCSNRDLPTSLGLGDLDQATPDSPSFATFTNVTPPTPPVPPPLRGDVFWSLISHLSLNYLSLLQVEALREVLRLYDFRAPTDRQAERALDRKLAGIVAIGREPRLRIHQGATVRGVGVALTLDEEKFGGEGEVFLFGSVLERFLAQYVSLNAFSQLTVRGKKFGEEHTWPPRCGDRSIL